MARKLAFWRLTNGSKIEFTGKQEECLESDKFESAFGQHVCRACGTLLLLAYREQFDMVDGKPICIDCMRKGDDRGIRKAVLCP
jgi:hypothetical protein